ncbi:MAG: PilZ domain-containing protein [Nitrospira sp.]|nr:PilZ domain-containing protein [Nitrospira sp.]
MDLRRHQRFPVSVQIVVSGPSRVEWAGTVMNLSKGGCLIQTKATVYSGMTVSLRFEIPGEPAPILVERAAVRWNRNNEIGLGFISVGQPHLERLERMIERLKPNQSH